MTDQIVKLQLALCLAKGPCPSCGFYSNPHVIAKCQTCHGTGKVPLLEGVREKCPSTHTEHWNGDKWQLQDCDRCQGRGWVPSQELENYFEALRPLYLAIEFSCQFPGWTCRLVGRSLMTVEGPWADTPKLAFCSALAKALGVKEECWTSRFA